MLVSIPSRQRHQLRWATPTLVAVLWLAFLWASTRPGGQPRALLLEWGALSGGQLPEDILRSWADAEHWLRLFNALFLPAAWAHLLGNLGFLLIFGLPATPVVGPGRVPLPFTSGGEREG